MINFLGTVYSIPNSYLTQNILSKSYSTIYKTKHQFWPCFLYILRQIGVYVKLYSEVIRYRWFLYTLCWTLVITCSIETCFVWLILEIGMLLFSCMGRAEIRVTLQILRVLRNPQVKILDIHTENPDVDHVNRIILWTNKAREF